MGCLSILICLVYLALVLSYNVPFTINPSLKQFYCSQLNVTEIEVMGSGFKEGMTLQFSNLVKSIVVESDSLIRIIRPGKKWQTGTLQVMSVLIDEQRYSLQPMIPVADIIEDIYIKLSAATYHPWKSKTLLIPTTVNYFGSQFNGSTMASAQLDIVPSDVFTFKANKIYNNGLYAYCLEISLKPGKSWLPSDFIFPNVNSFSVPVRVLSMDIGGGLIEYADPVIIGYITKDVDSYDRFVCNNSCPNSFDGVCGDVSKPLYHIYSQYSYIPPCDVDTDCTDCGGLDTVILYQNNTPITIEAPEVISKIYHKAPYVLVNGSGFVEGMKVELLNNKINLNDPVILFDTELISSNQIKIIARQSNFWSSTGFVTIKSIVGGTRAYFPNDGNGLVLYQVIPTPLISESSLRIHDSQSIVFVHSTGISDILDENKIKLSPTLDEAFELIATEKDSFFYDSIGLTLKLKNGYSWSGSTYMTDSQPIELKIVSIDTGAGIVPSEAPNKNLNIVGQIFPKTIGTIDKDNLDMICDNSCEYSLTAICNDKTSSKYFPDGDKICAPRTDCIDCGGYAMLAPVDSYFTVSYHLIVLLQKHNPVIMFQSATSELNMKLQDESAFHIATMYFTFEPPISRSDVQLIQQSSILTLKLKQNTKWPVGELKILSVNDIHGQVISPSYTDKLFIVAVILSDPVIYSASTKYYNTQSKVITIKGEGFTGDTQIELSPTKAGTYKAISYNENSISLLLHPTASWSSTETISSKLELTVVGVSSTAGKITFAKPVTVGYIVADSDGVKCDDTCKYAYDGVCDEGKSRCASGTDCTDCSIALALLNAVSLHSPSNDSQYSAWFIVSIVLVVLVVIAVFMVAYASCGRSVGSESGIAMEMVKYVAVPQVDSDCTYI